MNRKLDIFVPDEIESVINFLKTEKNITDITETGSISTIESDTLELLYIVDPILLKDGQIVTIDNVNYSVSNVNYDLKTFDISATGLTATKWNLAIDFKFGSRIEINKILANEARDTEKQMQRFPLVWLFINDAMNHDSLEYDFKTSLKMAFVHLSKPEYLADYRLENVIKPVLKPLETLFLEAIQSPYFRSVFNWEYTELNYTDYIRYFYGSADKNQMVLDAPTDAIEIDLDVLFQNQY